MGSKVEGEGRKVKEGWRNEDAGKRRVEKGR
jgi:hypothetical protein